MLTFLKNKIVSLITIIICLVAVVSVLVFSISIIKSNINSNDTITENESSKNEPSQQQTAEIETTEKESNESDTTQTTTPDISDEEDLKDKIIDAAYKVATEDKEYEDSLIFIDLDMDGIPECLLTAAAQNGHIGYLYKYSNGEYVKTSINTTWDNNVYAYEKNGRIIVVNNYYSWADDHTVFIDYNKGKILTEVWPHRDYSYDYVSDILAYYQDYEEISAEEYQELFYKYLDGCKELGKCPCSTMLGNLFSDDIYSSIKETYESIDW